MRVDRKSLLQKLLMVEPGTSKQETIQQSACVVLRRGRFYTLSQEIACSAPSGLPAEMEGAVRAEKLIEVLRQMPVDDVDVELGEKVLTIKAPRRRLRVAMEDETVLPVGEVELPKEWQALDEDFSEAVDLVHRCTKKAGDDFLSQCVHVCPEWLEASDNDRLIRYRVKVPVVEPVLVRGSSLKEMAELGMTKGAATDSWLHFRNPLGLRVSVRKFAQESYPDLSPFLRVRGAKVVLPKGLKLAADVAGVFQDDRGHVRLQFTNGELTVTGRCAEGEYTERCRLRYQGPDMAFLVPGKIVAELAERYTRCELTDQSFRVNGGKFIYCTSLEITK